jgi:hypothetical protein
MNKIALRSLLIALLLTSLTASSLNSGLRSHAQPRVLKSRALLVGINQYQQYPNAIRLSVRRHSFPARQGRDRTSHPYGVQELADS